MTSFALVLSGSIVCERTVTALALAERLVDRGHRVAVFAHGDAAVLAATGGELGEAVAALVRRGVREGLLDWVADADAVARRGLAGGQVTGVVPGDHADLWAFVRDADVVLSPAAAGPA